MRRLFPILSLLLVLAAGCFVYAKTGQFGAVDYDDPVYLTQQPGVAGGLSAEGARWAFTTLTGNLYSPLTWLSHQLDVSLFGMERLGAHHLMSVGLHLLSTTLAFALVLVLFPGRWGVAAFAAGAFCLHPLHVESVAWLSERKDVLSGLFFHASLLCYALWAGRERSHLLWAGSLVCFAAAILAKPAAVVLPAVLLLIDYYPLRRCGWEKGWNWDQPGLLPTLLRQLRSKWPFLLLAAASTLIGVHAQNAGSHGGQFKSPLLGRLAELPEVLAFYLERTLAPVKLAFHYPRPNHELFLGVINAHRLYLIAGVLLIAGIVWMIRSWLPSRRWALFGTGWFLATLAPVLGFVHVGTSFTSDRYTYLALLGPAAALGVGLPVLWKRIPKPLWSVLGIIILTCWTLLSERQVLTWKDNLSLFGHATRVQPRSSIAWTNYGAAHNKLGNQEAAAVAFEKSFAMQPDYVVAMNLGSLASKSGDREEAIQWHRKSLSIHPDYGPAHYRLGALLAKQAQPGTAAMTEALGHLERGARNGHVPDAAAIFAYANALLRSGQPAQVEEAKQVILYGLSLPGARADVREALEQLARAVGLPTSG